MVTFGQPLLRYETVDSTQNVAREKAHAGFPPGTVVAAETMTAGRGRRGRAWHTPIGANVCLTAVCPPVDDASILWQMAFVAGLAAVEAARQTVLNARAVLRFPNDVMAAGKKVGGILIETTTVDGKIVPLVGIGINVLLAPRPLEIARKATSLHEAAQNANASAILAPVADVEAALLSRLSARWNQWKTEGFAPILAAWNDCADFSQMRHFVIDSAPVSCCVESIALDGTVSLALPNGAQHTLQAGQVLLGDD